MDVRLLEQAAELGDPQAQYALGTAFLLGERVPQDATRALALFEKAAAQGQACAQCNLGAMYAQGLGVQRDYNEATRWYQLSANQGHADGQYNLAIVYAQGLGATKKNVAKARELCEKAAAQGQSQAKALLNSLRDCVEAGSSITDKRVDGRTKKAVPELAPTTLSNDHGCGLESSGPLPTLKDSSEAPHGVRMLQHDAASAIKHVLFCTGSPLEIHCPNGVWHGEEAEARFAKPGAKSKFRKLHLLKSLATAGEIARILHVAQHSIEFNIDNDSVDQRPTFESYVMQLGQFVHGELEPILRPLVEDRLMPYVRRKYNMPDAVACTALLRRYLPEERRVHPVHLDAHSFCTAVFGLNSGEFDGGLYVQPHPDARRREFVDLRRGDVAVHQYDLPHGVHVTNGRRYSLIFWIKDSVHSCITNGTPWYDSAAAAGDTDAMVALGQKLNKGMNADGIGSDPVRAAELFRCAADMGHVDAQIHLGTFYENGRGGLPLDGVAAVRWWRTAAEAGASAAQRLLAMAYANGACGLLRSSADAVQWMTRAAEQDDSDAMYWLSIYLSHNLGSPEDLLASLKWLQRAADMGHPEAQCGLGAAHLVGNGFEQNAEVAATWFRCAAQNGNSCAQCNMGALYAQGLGGLPLDFKQALRWYEASAEQGNADAQHNMALMYAQGLGGLPCDLVRAREWCEKAADQGQAKAMLMLQSLPLMEVRGALKKRIEELETTDKIEQVEERLAPADKIAQDVHKTGLAVTVPPAEIIAKVRRLLMDVRRKNDDKNDATHALLNTLMSRIDALDAATADPEKSANLHCSRAHSLSALAVQKPEAQDTGQNVGSCQLGPQSAHPVAWQKRPFEVERVD